MRSNAPPSPLPGSLACAALATPAAGRLLRRPHPRRHKPLRPRDPRRHQRRPGAVQARPGGPETEIAADRSDRRRRQGHAARAVESGRRGDGPRVGPRCRARAGHPRRAREDRAADRRQHAARAGARGPSRGPSGLIDYIVTVPRWMPVNLSGTYLAAQHRRHERRGERRDRGRRHHAQGRLRRRHAALDRRRDQRRERQRQGAGHDRQRLDSRHRRLRRRGRRDDQRRRHRVELQGVEPRGVDGQRRRALRRARPPTRASTA